MSSDTDAAAATAALFDGLYTNRYCAMAASVFFIYDTFITFDRELASFWTPKQSGAALLFFANKWFSMTIYVMDLVGFASLPSNKSCSVFTIVQLAMSILQFLPGAAFSALRAYVLSRQKLLGLLVFTLSLAPAVANLVLYGYQVSGENLPPFGCLRTDNTNAALETRLTIISRVPLIAGDILLIYITWTTLKGWPGLKDIRQSNCKRLSLSVILFHGGVLYFAVLSTLNVLHLVLSVTASAGDADPGQSLVSAFTAPLTAILISRFLLTLQEANTMVVRLHPDDPLYSSRDLYNSTPSFISSLGGFVNPDLWARSDEDDNIELQVRSPAEIPDSEGEPPQADALTSSA